MCEENRRADRHQWWLRTDMQDIRIQDGFSADSFASANVRTVSSAKKTTNMSTRSSKEYKNMFIRLYKQYKFNPRTDIDIVEIYVDLQYKIGYNRITVIKLLHQIAYTLMIQMQS